MRKILTISAVLIFVFIAVFGLNLSMQMHDKGDISNCPFMLQQSSMCQMSAGDYLSMWRQIFTATPQLIYFLVFLAAFAFIRRFLISQFTLAPPKALAFYRYKTNHPDTKLFNDLLQAFSNGILHPKIYS